MPVRLNSSGGGSVTLDVPSTAGTFTATIPANSGTVVTTGSTAAVTPAMLTQPLTFGTAQNASGTAIDFTGIPSWVRRVTVMFNGVSTNTTSGILVQVGSGSVVTTGYTTAAMSIEGTNTTSVTTGSGGFLILRATIGAAAAVITGHLVITNISGNNWVASGIMARTDNGVGTMNTGSIGLSGALDRVRITTSTGTDVFDAGSINLIWE